MQLAWSGATLSSKVKQRSNGGFDAAFNLGNHDNGMIRDVFDSLFYDRVEHKKKKYVKSVENRVRSQTSS